MALGWPPSLQRLADAPLSRWMHVGINGVWGAVGNFVFCWLWEIGGWVALTMGRGVPVAKGGPGQSRTAVYACGIRVEPPSFCTHPCHVHYEALAWRVLVGLGWVVGVSALVVVARSSK